MARYLNQVTLLGNLGNDPEVRNFQNGGRVLAFNVATSEFWKDRNGEQRERTEWHCVAVFVDALIDVGETFLRKGCQSALNSFQVTASKSFHLVRLLSAVSDAV